MSRVNLCTNPHADVDTTGWTSNGSLTRVTATGFPKANAVESSSGTSLVWTARGAVTPGTEYTISAQIKNTGPAAGNANPFIEWRDASDASLSYSSGTSTTCPTNIVTTVSATGTAPANAAYAALLIGNMFGIRQVGAVLIEPAATPSAYADGDTAGWSWNGTAGLSASGESATQGVLAGALPVLAAPGGTAAATLTTPGALAGALPVLAAPGGQFVGPVSGVLAGVLPSLPAVVTAQPTIARYRAAGPSRNTRWAASTPTRPDRWKVGALPLTDVFTSIYATVYGRH